MMLYVNRIDLKTRTFTDVFIEDRRAAKVSVTVVAPKGKLISEPETGTFHLLLFDGTVNQVDLEKRSVNAIRFDKYQVSLNARKAMSSAKNFQKGPKEMNPEELSRYIESLKSEKNAEYYLALLDFHKRFSVPFACFALGFLAIPLGIRAKSARKSFGIGLGLGFFILYYAMLSAGLVFGEAGVYPPIIGMWVPNIVTTAIGVRLFDSINRDRPMQFRLWRF
ncbi:MAG: YjgP/YjgQ family permease [Desulfobacteraceae bacterium]|nr:YjgP/YjgQ family permease [Desulfobacteraceae bacterium]